MITTVLSHIIAIAFFLILLFMPLWTAIGVRIIFRRANEKLLATATALPFTVLLSTRRELFPDSDWGDYDYTIKIMMLIMVLFATFLINFGIPFLMAKGGVGIGNRIIRRNLNHIEPTVKNAG